ncbi:Transmembrane protein 236 [Oryzias melastigma]|uniref:Transmembrane protein 236 n=1 Tax=Oryzias melastigma TaxID=30732 RepID=A0A834FGY0_ORYME|nr:Transmembrane protein 236 [Oryzias melastigma]
MIVSSCSPTMLSGKTVKLLLYEGLQFAALVVPVFVVMERFARVIRVARGWDETAYWLVVAASIAYVTSVTLLVWAPLKYVTLKKRRVIAEITQWRPTTLAYLLLSTLPCFAVMVAGYKVQMDSGLYSDPFTELPVSLVLFCLICVDVVERIRPWRLMGKSDSFDPDGDVLGPVPPHLERVTTVSAQLPADGGQEESVSNGGPPGRWSEHADSSRPPSLSARTYPASYLYSSSSLRPLTYSGPLRVLWRRDGRAELFVGSFLFWLDTVEMLRSAGQPSVFGTAWVFPVYILTFLSALRVVIAPQSALLSLAGVALQDFPFFVLRFALMVAFGFVTPVLYLLKNLLVCLSYGYFTWLSRLTPFRGHSMF